MARRKLSKKRNSLLMFEFLVREATRRLLANDEKGAARVVDLVRESFAPGTQLHRELRIARTLRDATADSETLATRVVSEARLAMGRVEIGKLESEKTKLIERVARDVDSSGALYDEPIDDYRILSTIGALVRDWTSEDADIVRAATYEERLLEHLTRKKSSTNEIPAEQNMTQGERRLVIATMTRKLEERWGSLLFKEQKDLLRRYVLSEATSDPAELLPTLRTVRETVVSDIDRCLSSEASDTYFAKRLVETRERIVSDGFDTITDDVVARCMLYLKLSKEINDVERNA